MTLERLFNVSDKEIQKDLLLGISTTAYIKAILSGILSADSPPLSFEQHQKIKELSEGVDNFEDLRNAVLNPDN